MSTEAIGKAPTLFRNVSVIIWSSQTFEKKCHKILSLFLPKKPGFCACFQYQISISENPKRLKAYNKYVLVTTELYTFTSMQKEPM